MIDYLFLPAAAAPTLTSLKGGLLLFKVFKVWNYLNLAAL